MTYIPAGRWTNWGNVQQIGAFCMDILETTVGDYRECVKARRCTLPKKKNFSLSEDRLSSWVSSNCNYYQNGRERDAIDCVSFWQAKDYCEFRRKRLPTQNEWERAAGREDGRPIPWSNEQFRRYDVCWQRTPSQGTCVVGSHPKDVSPYGIKDMAGNAPEWAYEEQGDGPIRFVSTYGMRWSFGPGWLYWGDFSLFASSKGHSTDTDGEAYEPWAGIRCVHH
jgi:formylglycine-generating enzyme required for sulfatase activity